MRPDHQDQEAEKRMTAKIECRHAYKVGPGCPACCLMYYADKKHTRALPPVCRAKPKHYEGKDRGHRVKKCCAACDYVLAGCPHPKWRCEDGAKARRNGVEIAYKADGKLY
jgi:hypothetical protein